MEATLVGGGAPQPTSGSRRLSCQPCYAARSRAASRSHAYTPTKQMARTLHAVIARTVVGTSSVSYSPKMPEGRSAQVASAPRPLAPSTSFSPAGASQWMDGWVGGWVAFAKKAAQVGPCASPTACPRGRACAPACPTMPRQPTPQRSDAYLPPWCGCSNPWGVLRRAQTRPPAHGEHRGRGRGSGSEASRCQNRGLIRCRRLKCNGSKTLALAPCAGPGRQPQPPQHGFGMPQCTTLRRLRQQSTFSHLVQVLAVKHDRGGGSVDQGGNAARHAAVDHVLYKRRRSMGARQSDQCVAC